MERREASTRGEEEAAPSGPTAEDRIRTVVLTLADALEAAAAGNWAHGYLALTRGLLQAERELIWGEPGAAGWVAAWREAIDRFCERTGPHGDEEG